MAETQLSGESIAKHASTIRLIEAALAEDGADKTSECLLDNRTVQAVVVCKQRAVVCGLELARLVFTKVDPAISFSTGLRDGNLVNADQQVFTVEGPALTLLRGERVALNFLQHLSGVATMTKKFVDAVKDTPVKILDTRKTIPGWRLLQKYAVRTGGGFNHRLSLSDMLLVKENHLTIVGSIDNAVERLKSFHSELNNIEVEAQTTEEVEKLIALGVRRIMLDNFDPVEIGKVVKRFKGKAEFEASGGISLSTVHEYALTGVDYISIGALTHSAPAVDFSMLVHS